MLLLRRALQRDDIRCAAHLPAEHLRGVRLLAVSLLRHLQRCGTPGRLARSHSTDTCHLDTEPPDHVAAVEQT